MPGAEVIGKYETLGVVGILLLCISLFLLAIFKEPPWLVTQSQYNSALEAEREKVRIALEAKDEAERRSAHFAHVFEEILDRTLGHGSNPTRGDGDV